MTESEELAVYKLIIDNCHTVGLNLNDTFYYASADAENVDAYDMEEIIPIIKKYGRSALVAFAAIKRGHNPQIPKNITENFINAKKELEELAKDGTIMYDEFYDKNIRKNK